MPGPGDLARGWGKMKGGYRQNTFGFGQLLMWSKPVQKIEYMYGLRIADRYRRTAPRGHEAQRRSADTTRVMQPRLGGRKGDRSEVIVKAKVRNKAGFDAMKNTVVFISKGKKISRGGRVS
jgi:hypothetical protein